MIAQEPLSFAARIQKFRLFCKTWPAGRLKLGNQHPDTMISIYNFAFLLKSMEKFKEAEEFFREHLAACDFPSILSMSFSLHRCVQKCSEETWFVIPGSWQPPFLFSELLHIWCGTCQGVAVHGEHHKQTLGSRRSLVRFLKDLAPCGHGPCLISDSRHLEVHVSRNLTSAGAREGGGGTGLANCPVKAGREGVRKVHQLPVSLLMMRELGEGVGSEMSFRDVWNLHHITRTFAPQAVSVD